MRHDGFATITLAYNHKLRLGSDILSPLDVPTLTMVAYIGEDASQADILAWCDSFRLANVYGPAECCVFATMQPYMTAVLD